MQPVKLIAAESRDIPVIGALATRIWNQHYPSIIGQEQVNYMLGKMYSAESLLEQLQEKKHRFFLVYAGEQQLGFLSVHPDPDGTPDGKSWFLSKFYIDQQQAGKGLGTLAFQEMLRITGAKQIRLTVNRQNFKAINFYFKLGFRIEKVADFAIGEGFVMNDFVMVWME